MDYNNSIIKSNLEQSLKRLHENSIIAQRGLRDLGIWPKIDELLKSVEHEFHLGNYKECVRLCDSILAQEQFHFLALSYKALSFEYLFEFSMAIEWFDKALDVEPKVPEVIAHKGACLLLTGEDDEASVCFDLALSLDEDNVTVMYYKGSGAWDEKEALHWWNRILKKDPENIFILSEKGDTLTIIGNYHEAIEAYENALQHMTIQKFMKDPYYQAHRLFLLQKLSDIFIRIGRYSQALEIFKEILTLEPDNVYAIKGLQKYSSKI